MARAKILVVDDDDLVRKTVTAMLRDEGYDVVIGNNGNAAIAMLEPEPADLVILDIIMPEREGIKTLREIGKHWPEIPVLMISGGDRTGWTDGLSMAVKLGASATLAKPLNKSDLVDRVRQLLRPAA